MYSLQEWPGPRLSGRRKHFEDEEPNFSSIGERPPISELGIVAIAWLIKGKTVSDAQRLVNRSSCTNRRKCSTNRALTSLLIWLHLQTRQEVLMFQISTLMSQKKYAASANRRPPVRTLPPQPRFLSSSALTAIYFKMWTHRDVAYNQYLFLYQTHNHIVTEKGVVL